MVGVGMAFVMLLSFLLVGSTVGGIFLAVKTETAPSPIDYGRWFFSVSIVLGLWTGAEVARYLWVGLTGLAFLLVAGGAVLARIIDDPRWVVLSVGGVGLGIAMLILWGMLFNPCTTAFLEWRRGERR